MFNYWERLSCEYLIEKKVILTLVIAFLLRFSFVFIYPQFPVVSDAKDYDSLGWNLARGNGFMDEAGKAEIHRSPGYPFFLAVIYKIFGHSYKHVRSWQVLFSILTLLLIFLITKDIFGKNTALLKLPLPSIRNWVCLKLFWKILKRIQTFLFLK